MNLPVLAPDGHNAMAGHKCGVGHSEAQAHRNRTTFTALNLQGLADGPQYRRRWVRSIGQVNSPISFANKRDESRALLEPPVALTS
jgi:hypothetical protein